MIIAFIAYILIGLLIAHMVTKYNINQYDHGKLVLFLLFMPFIISWIIYTILIYPYIGNQKITREDEVCFQTKNQ